MVFDFRGRTGEPEVAAAHMGTDQPDRSVEPEATASEEPTATPSAEPSPSESERAKPRPPVRLVTEGVTIQVLNGTNDPEAGNAMADELTKLGFQVVTVEATSKPYKATTVYWSFPDATKAGEALAAKRGWEVDQKPGNLADTVHLHVVVGSDFLD